MRRPFNESSREDDDRHVTLLMQGREDQTIGGTMKKLGLSAMLAAVLGVAAFSLADAQGERRGPGFGPGGPGSGRGFGMLRGVELTDAQRDQVRTIMQEWRDDASATHNLQRQLRTELLADTPDEAKIASLREQIVGAHNEMLTRHIDTQRKIAQVLTPEQRAKAREALSDDSGARRGRGRRGVR
jgi:Spy/CpxP family protein refolding chaperone